MDKPKILVVEDETIIAKSLQSSLQSQGYIVPTIVATGEGAIKHVEEERFDLILMDIVLLGDIDGIEAASRIHDKHNIPIIYLTAYADEKILQRAKITEPFGYIIKPFEDRELHSAIQVALYKHGMDKERELLKTELAQKNRDLEQILYVTTHDLRSPLVNIQGFGRELDISLTELNEIVSTIEIPEDLKDAYNTIIMSDIPKSLKFIQSSISKMDSLISGLLSISRLGQTQAIRQELNINRMVSEILRTFEFRIKETNTEVSTSDLPPCYGDELQINRVFSNLLENALKFQSTDRPGRINIYGNIEDDNAVYYVEDNGIGIAPEHQDKIFEIFHQLEPAMTGEGLGLSIVRKILERYHGKIRVKSEQGKGSRFILTLPRQRE